MKTENRTESELKALERLGKLSSNLAKAIEAVTEAEEAEGRARAEYNEFRRAYLDEFGYTSQS